MDLPTALRVISSLEGQLKELESFSREYESEMEQVIDKLRNDYVKVSEGMQGQKSAVTKLEIRIDELESENSYLINKVRALELENDRQLEQNVLLEHEMHDLQELLVNKAQPDINNKKLKLNNNEPLRVSTLGSSLLIAPRKSSLRNAANTQLTTSRVLSTTSSRAK